MTSLDDLGRRSVLKIAAALGGASTVGALPDLAGAQDTPQQTDAPAVTLQDVPFSSAAMVTIETEEEALSRLDAQLGALFHTQDFLEGRKAEAEGRKPVYQRK